MTKAETIPAVAGTQHISEKKHLWPSLARDIIMMSSPDAGSTVTPDLLLAVYNITPEEFHIISRLPVFNDLCREEATKLKEGGAELCHRYRVESMVARLGDIIYSRCVNDKSVEIKDAVNFYRTLLESVGMIGGKKGKEVSAQANVAIQLNLPQLRNKKLQHLQPRVITQAQES